MLLPLRVLAKTNTGVQPLPQEDASYRNTHTHNTAYNRSTAPFKPDSMSPLCTVPPKQPSHIPGTLLYSSGCRRRSLLTLWR